MANGHSGKAAVAAAPAGAKPSYPKTRRLRFNFGEGAASGKYFVDDDIVFSHFVAGLSGGFPPGRKVSSDRCGISPIRSRIRC